MDIIHKKAYEKFPREIDFTPNLATGETVVSHDLTCVDTATGLSSSTAMIDSSSLATPVVTIIVKGGVTGGKHHIQVLATTSLGNVYDKDIMLEIVETIEGVFTKQPNDKFIVAADFTSKLATGETLNSRTVTAVKKSDGSDATSTVVYSSAIDGNRILIGVQAGATGECYQIVAKVVTSNSYQRQLDIMVSVQEL